MFTSQLMRVAAAFLLIGGVFGIIGAVIMPGSPDIRTQVTSSLFVPAHTLAFLAGLLTVVGLPAVYSRLFRDAGWVGAIGFGALMVVGIMLGFFPDMLALVMLPWLATMPIPADVAGQGPPSFFVYFAAAGVVALIGAVLFGIAIVRTEVFTRWIGYLLILAGIVNLAFVFVPNAPALVQAISPVLFYIALLWMGAELWQSAEEPAAI